ncbi:hypothetical protein C8R44DRAFT_765935 [Mycena epipterygia]|nr:hypothetical protein C8R44DRAFT_765935 [Mycena epipterygia]
MLVGTTACLNVCAAEGAVQFPKTNAVLLACSHALASTPAVGAAYMSVLLAIYVQRRSGSLPRQEELEEELRRPPEIRLVQDLELEGVRLWGCIPKADVDVAVFGSGICINVDMARALEGTQDPYVELACKVLLCTTMAHEEMHLLNHRFFPELRLQKNPPDIGSVLGESGWAFEDLCFGSQVMVTWASQAHIGDFESIDRVTLRKPLSTATQHILSM